MLALSFSPDTNAASYHQTWFRLALFLSSFSRKLFGAGQGHRFRVALRSFKVGFEPCPIHLRGLPTTAGQIPVVMRLDRRAYGILGREKPPKIAKFDGILI